MGRHAPSAEIANPAGGDAGDEHEISWLEGTDVRADCLDHAQALVSENAAREDAGHVTLQDMEVRAANRRGRDSNDCVAALTNSRLGLCFPRSLAGTVVDQSLHDAVFTGIGRLMVDLSFNAAHDLFPDEVMLRDVTHIR